MNRQDAKVAKEKKGSEFIEKWYQGIHISGINTLNLLSSPISNALC